jgi:hypothetical protein
VEPGLGNDRRQIEIANEGFRVALLDEGEAPELALDPVVVAVAIAIGADERRVGDEILDLEPLDDLNGEGELGDPRAARQPVLQIEFGRGCVLDFGDRAHVVVGRDQQMRLLATHQVDIAHVAARIAGQRRHPDEA